MFIFLISRLAARRVVHCVGPPSYRKSPITSFPRFYSSCPTSHHAMPATITSFPPRITPCPRFYSSFPASHHAMPATITSFPQPSRHSRGSIRHSPPRITPCPQPSRHFRNHHVIPAVLFVIPRLASRHARNHHVIPAVLFVMPRLASRHFRGSIRHAPPRITSCPPRITSFPQPSRHSREGGNLTPHFRRAFLGTPPPRYIERNRSAKIVDRVVAIQVEFS